MTVTAAQAIQNFQNNPNIPPQLVADTAANVAAALDGLQALTNAGKLQTISFTDPAPPSLSLSAAQLSRDAGTLAKIYASPTPYVYVSAVAANGIPVGSDTHGNGSAASPYATLAKAEANVLAGQTILLNGSAANPTAYASATVTASNTTIDSVQAFGAEIVGTGSTDLTIAPKAGGTVTLGRVIVNAGGAEANAVVLAPSPAGAYSVVFNGSKIENFTALGVVGEAANVSATFSGAQLTSSSGATSAIYFDNMASGALDVENTQFTMVQALTDYGVIDVSASAAGATVKVDGANIAVTSVSGNAPGGYHFAVRLTNIQGAVVENNAISIDSSAAPTWGAKGVSIETATTGTSVNCGGFVIAGNKIAINDSYSVSAIEIGEEGDQAQTRGLFNGGVVHGNTISGSPATQAIESQGIFVGSQANTDVYGNNITDFGIGLVDKDALNSVYYANTVKGASIDDALIKGSMHTTFVNNNLLTGDSMYPAYGLHIETNSDTGDKSSNAIVSANTFISSTSGFPRFVQVDAGQSADLSRNAYVSSAPLGSESWQWLGRNEVTYAAWQAASQERGGSYRQGSDQPGPLNPYPLPLNSVAPLTPGQKLSSYGLLVTGVTASSAPQTAAMPDVIGVSVVDTAAHVASDLNSLETVALAGELTSIAFSDPGTPTLLAAADVLYDDATALDAIVGSYKLAVTGPMRALQATKLEPALLTHLTSGLAINDSAANVESDLDNLQGLAASNELGSITLTDSSAATLAITTGQLVTDAKALAKISTTHDLLLSGALSVSGTVYLPGAGPTSLMVGAAGLTVSGGGTLNIGSSGANGVVGASAAAVLTNAGAYIVGAGDIGGGRLTLVNNASGVIAGNYSTALVLDTGANIIVNAGRIENMGSGGTFVRSAVNNSGALIAEGGSLTVSGAVTGTGDALIYSGVLSFASAFGETVVFKSTTGALVLAKSQAYSGTIYGFSTTGGTMLDLKDIAFGGSTTASYSGTTSSGVLTITDGTRTAHIKLSGNYLGSKFTASADGQGGTDIVDPARHSDVSQGLSSSAAAAQRLTAAMAMWGTPTAGTIPTPDRDLNLSAVSTPHWASSETNSRVRLV